MEFFQAGYLQSSFRRSINHDGSDEAERGISRSHGSEQETNNWCGFCSAYSITVEGEKSPTGFSVFA